MCELSRQRSWHAGSCCGEFVGELLRLLHVDSQHLWLIERLELSESTHTAWCIGCLGRFLTLRGPSLVVALSRLLEGLIILVDLALKA